MKLKYNNIPVTYEREDGAVLKFDSKFEFETWKVALDAMKAIPRNKRSEYELERQREVLIQPPTKNFSKIIWKIDFCLTRNTVPISYIEAKGFPTESFKLKLKILGYNQPDVLDKLVIVSSRRQKLGKYLESVDLHELRNTVISSIYKESVINL